MESKTILEAQTKEIFFVDVETTGFDTTRNEMITLSISCFDIETGAMKNEEEFKFKPLNLKYWTKEAQSKHKITLPMSLQFPDRSKEIIRFLEWIEGESQGSAILCCHAFDMYNKQNYFDVNMIKATLSLYGLEARFNKTIRFFESTDSIFRALKKDKLWEGTVMKLNVLCKEFNIELDHHNAKSDRVACEKLYYRAKEIRERGNGFSL